MGLVVFFQFYSYVVRDHTRKLKNLLLLASFFLELTTTTTGPWPLRTVAMPWVVMKGSEKCRLVSRVSMSRFSIGEIKRF